MQFMLLLISLLRSRLFSAFFVLNACHFPLITMICFLIFSKDKCRDEELSSVTLCGLQSCSLSKQDETDRVELIAKPCFLGKCLWFPCFVLISRWWNSRRNIKKAGLLPSMITETKFESPLRAWARSPSETFGTSTRTEKVLFFFISFLLMLLHLWARNTIWMLQ